MRAACPLPSAIRPVSTQGNTWQPGLNRPHAGRREAASGAARAQKVGIQWGQASAPLPPVKISMHHACRSRCKRHTWPSCGAASRAAHLPPLRFASNSWNTRSLCTVGEERREASMSAAQARAHAGRRGAGGHTCTHTCGHANTHARTTKLRPCTRAQSSHRPHHARSRSASVGGSGKFMWARSSVD